MISIDISMYVVLMKTDSLGRVIRLFPVLGWKEREDNLVAVIPTSLHTDDFKSAYPVDSPEVIEAYGYVLNYVMPPYLDDCIAKWEDWIIDGDGDRLFFIFGKDF